MHQINQQVATIIVVCLLPSTNLTSTIRPVYAASVYHLHFYTSAVNIPQNQPPPLSDYVFNSGGDCCVDSCKPNAAVIGSCTTLPVAACLDPKYSNPNTTPADVLPPVIIPPADYTTTCNSTLVGTTVSLY
jgi:hypothetical protein